MADRVLNCRSRRWWHEVPNALYIIMPEKKKGKMSFFPADWRCTRKSEKEKGEFCTVLFVMDASVPLKDTLIMYYTLLPHHIITRNCCFKRNCGVGSFGNMIKREQCHFHQINFISCVSGSSGNGNTFCAH